MLLWNSLSSDLRQIFLIYVRFIYSEIETSYEVSRYRNEDRWESG